MNTTNRLFRLDRLLTLYFFYPLMRILPQRKELRIPILMYHSISENLDRRMHPYYQTTTSPHVFAEHMKFLYENNYKVVGLNQAVRILKSSDTNFSVYPTNHDTQQTQVTQQTMAFNEPHYAVLTFDDGFRDFYTEAFPILQEYGFSATMFLPTAFIDNKRLKFKGKECLSWKEVRELRSYGVSFGSHTVNHPTLYGLPWKEVHRELLDSRLRLEDELQAPVTCFAYPYAFPQEDGSFIQRFRQELIDQGYLTSVTTLIGRMRPGSNPLCLERLPVNEGDDVQLFEAKLYGAYDWLAGAQALVKRMKLYLRSFRPFNA